jgi:branched-chain amino acid transport system permease protein
VAALATSYRKEMRIVRGRAQLGWLALLIAVLLYLPTVLETRTVFGFYYLTETQVLGIGLAQVNFALIAIMGAVALNLLVGYTGLLSLGHSAFFAMGAMSGGVLGVQAGLPFIVVVLGAGLFGALVGTVVGLPSLRLRGLYLLLSTLALHFIVIYLFLRYQLGQFGPAGISFDTASLFGLEIATDKRWYFVLLIVAALFIVITRNLLKMREGRAFIAIRDHEVAAAATGVNPALMKLKAFAVSSFMVSVAGVLYAYNLGTATSESYTLNFTIDFYAMVIIGGMGSLLGAVLGAIVWQLLPQVLQTLSQTISPDTPILGDLLDKYRAYTVSIILGLTIILILIYKPAGLSGIWKAAKNSVTRWPYTS